MMLLGTVVLLAVTTATSPTGAPSLALHIPDDGVLARMVYEVPETEAAMTKVVSKDWSPKTPILLYSGLSLADLLSTEWAMAKNDELPGRVGEGNFLGQTLGARIALKVVGTGAFVLLDKACGKDKKLRTALRVVVIAGHAYLVVNNVRNGIAFRKQAR